MAKSPLISVLTPSIRPEGLKRVQDSLAQQTFQDFEWLTEISIPEKGCDLNAAYNRMLKRAKGELVVSLQDFIRIPSDGLQRFWEAYTEHPDTFFTAPVGQTLDYEHIQWDWRKNPDATMNWHSWEIDWGAAPLGALLKIGGFDEELDNGWSYDNVNVGLRAEMAGYKFALLDIPAIAYDHHKTMPHPFLPQQDATLHNQRLDQIRRGEFQSYV